MLSPIHERPCKSAEWRTACARLGSFGMLVLVPVLARTRAVSGERPCLVAACASGSRRARIIETIRRDGDRAVRLAERTGHYAQ